MRHAPPVQVRCSGAAWRAVQAVLMALAAGVLCVWALQHAALNAWPAAAVAALVGALAWHGLRADPEDLVWDGQRWRVGNTVGGMDVMIDLGAWMLLRLRPVPAAPARWIAVSPAEAGAALHGLRAALYARVPLEGDHPGAQRSG